MTYSNNETDKQHIGTCIVVTNPQGKVLLGKRKNGFKPGWYGMPGGRVELNEPLELSAQRELLEETGLKVEKLRYLGVIRQNQGEFDFIHFVFAVENVKDQPLLTEPDKCEGWQWLDIEAVEDQVLAGHRASYQMLITEQQLLDITT